MAKVQLSCRHEDAGGRIAQRASKAFARSLPSTNFRNSFSSPEGARVGIARGKSEATCPVRALQAWLRAVEIVQGAVFRAVTSRGIVRSTALSGEAVCLIVLKRAMSAGFAEEPTTRPDPDIEQMGTDFRRALAKLVPVFMPDILFRLAPGGIPLFEDFAAAIQPTEFVLGRVFGTGTMAPMDYLVAMAEGRIAPPAKLDIATIQQQELATTFRFHISQYLMRRAADWQALGVTETLSDWAALNARSKFWGDDQRSAFKNW